MDKAYTPVGTLAQAAETLRGVRCVRLSVRTDETTSPERQRESDDQAAAALDISFGEGAALREAVDLDVSASKVGPFERPQLGAWLKRPADFDALVFWRFDRAIRSMQDMHELAKWARTHRKMIIFAEGLGGTGRLVFDFRNPMDPMSELMMMMFAFAAQVEGQSIKDRVTGAQAAMRKMPLRWRGGGQPAYGYLPAPMPAEYGGVGWTLVPDLEAIETIERIIAALAEGDSPLTIARALNADGVLSPSAHWAAYRARTKHNGAKPEDSTHPKRKPAQWRDKTIVKMLTSPAIMGWKIHRGNPVRDDQGAPVLAAENAILTREEFDQVGALLAPKPVAERPPVRKDSGALLLRVIHCGSCGSRMYLRKARPGKGRDVYQCSSYKYGANCAVPSTVRAEWVDQYVTAEFLRLVGPVHITRTVEIPGYDPQPEIDATLAEFEEHQKQKGRQKSKTAQAAWQRHADSLDARLAELEAREKTEPRREILSTGRTYADNWNSADTMARRTMLVEAGASLTVKRGTKGGWRTLDLRRVEFTITGDLDPAVEENVTVADELATENNPDHAPTAGARAHRNLTPQTLVTAA
ncbi:recombinase family protein [Streptomyces sp. cg36]|uniref:recombinase family protein n=1 Tax=Streptomyces sp. cg36 TaxID=3238798 RepID=UPI0034E2E1B4